VFLLYNIIHKTTKKYIRAPKNTLQHQKILESTKKYIKEHQKILESTKKYIKEHQKILESTKKYIKVAKL
jgi:hypothetical protein